MRDLVINMKDTDTVTKSLLEENKKIMSEDDQFNQKCRNFQDIFNTHVAKCMHK